jgi:hypothetical protein
VLGSAIAIASITQCGEEVVYLSIAGKFTSVGGLKALAEDFDVLGISVQVARQSFVDDVRLLPMRFTSQAMKLLQQIVVNRDHIHGVTPYGGLLALSPKAKQARISLSIKCNAWFMSHQEENEALHYPTA